MKKAEDYWNELSFGDKTTNQYCGFIKAIKQAQLDILEYSVNKCAENANMTLIPKIDEETKEIDSFWGINKQSILKTIDEIKEELK